MARPIIPKLIDQVLNSLRNKRRSSLLSIEIQEWSANHWARRNRCILCLTRWRAGSKVS